MGDRINSEDILYPGDERKSESGEYRFTYQQDGNLVLYRNDDAIWAANTNVDDTTNFQLLMQRDGNLVIYTSEGQPMWASETGGLSNPFLLIQNDGNVCLYDNDQEGCFWTTNTAS